MATDKRTRQKQGRTTRLAAARTQRARMARRRRVVSIGAIIGVLGILVGTISVFGGATGDNANATTTTTTAALTTTTASDGITPVELKGPGHGAELIGETPCPKADGTQERTTKFQKAPPMCIDAAKTYTATFETTKGQIVVDLDAKKAPQTVNNFVVLARYKFFDGQPIFRLVTDFAAQFGDPSAQPTNASTFGYTIPDENPQKGEYKVGSLAMANTGAPDSGGSQMFFILGQQGVELQPNYALFGQANDASLPVIAAINAVPNKPIEGNDGAPAEQVTINSVTIAEA